MRNSHGYEANALVLLVDALFAINAIDEVILRNCMNLLRLGDENYYDWVIPVIVEHLCGNFRCVEGN